MTCSVPGLALVAFLALPIAPSVASPTLTPTAATIAVDAAARAPAARARHKSPSTATLRARLKKAQIQAKAAAATAREATAARDRAQARYERSGLLNLALGALAGAMLLALAWMWWRRRVAKVVIVALEKALATARRSLEDMSALDTTLARARIELAERDAQRRNNDQVIANLRAEIEDLKAAAEHRAMASGRAQLRTLDRAAREGDVVEPCPPLNGEERNVMRAASIWASERDLRLYPQVGMGGFLRPLGRHADEVLKTLNSKRCDFVLCDLDDKVVLIVEHHGSGHEKGDWEIRDKVKRRLLNLARIGLVVTLKDDGEPQIRRRLDAALKAPTEAIPCWPEVEVRRKAGTFASSWRPSGQPFKRRSNRRAN